MRISEAQSHDVLAAGKERRELGVQRRERESRKCGQEGREKGWDGREEGRRGEEHFLKNGHMTCWRQERTQENG